MEHLKITFNLVTSIVVPSYPIHLDALLAFSKVNRAIKGGFHEDPYSEQENLPLDRIGKIWKASQLFFTPIAEAGYMHFIKKSKIEDFAAASGRFYESKINHIGMKSGKYKSFSMLMSIQPVSHAVAWCMGDKEQIRDLLNDITTIGKKFKNDMGRVKNFTIETATEDETECWRLRVLPKNSGFEMEGAEYATAIACCSPPYWDRTRQEVALIPCANL